MCKYLKFRLYRAWINSVSIADSSHAEVLPDCSRCDAELWPACLHLNGQICQIIIQNLVTTFSLYNHFNPLLIAI